MSELKYTPKDFKSDQEKRWLNWAIPKNPGL